MSFHVAGVPAAPGGRHAPGQPGRHLWAVERGLQHRGSSSRWHSHHPLRAPRALQGGPGRPRRRPAGPVQDPAQGRPQRFGSSIDRRSRVICKVTTAGQLRVQPAHAAHCNLHAAGMGDHPAADCFSSCEVDAACRAHAGKWCRACPCSCCSIRPGRARSSSKA